MYNILIALMLNVTASEFKKCTEEDSGYAVIYSYSQIIYDDGIDRTQYFPFDIFDLSGKQILSVGYNFDSPAVVKLQTGKYLIKLLNLKGDAISHRISIEKDSIKNFSFTE
ncbi:hypothetical protein ASZ90_005429 [hydrocarbon metagenome]|uniref:Uncharacterized protein n=1 Tax=hydrocarbon metagenome TaxID=938273 RepID=A0A0W8FVE2_9ZZZZ